MLVLARQLGESIIVGGGPPDGCLITVIAMRGQTATVQIDHGSAASLRKRKPKPRTLAVGESLKVDDQMSVTLVDVRAEKVRLGILAPKRFAVHRLEVWEAIARENRIAQGHRDDADDDGTAGAPVRRPTGPKPSPLDVRLDEPNG